MQRTSTFRGIPNNTDPTWWKDRSMRWNCVWILTCALGSTYYGYDSALLSGLQALPKFIEYFPSLATNANVLGLTTAAQFVPGLFMPFVASWISDRYDRKPVMIVAAIGVIIGAVVQCTSQSLGQFIGSRVIVGVAGQMVLAINPTMLVEIAHPRIRSVASALCLSLFFIGSIIAGWTNFGTLQHMPNSDWSWRLPCLFQAIVPALILPLCIMIPHSPRWLVATGRVDDAHTVLAEQHANGDRDDALVKFELQEIQAAIDLERAGKSTSYLSFLQTKGNRKRIFLVVSIAFGGQWNGVGIIFYYLVPVLKSVNITSPTSQTLVVAGIAISSFFFALTGTFLVERAGRRPLWLVSTGLMVISLILATALSATFIRIPNAGIGGAVIAFLYLAQGGYTLAWTPLNFAYNVEILPYNLRTKGMAIWGLVNSASLVVQIWVNSIALEAIGWKYYIVYVVFDTYLFLLIWFVFPETKGLSLEEVAIRFDGPQADRIVPGYTTDLPAEDVRMDEYKSGEEVMEKDGLVMV